MTKRECVKLNDASILMELGRVEAALRKVITWMKLAPVQGRNAQALDYAELAKQSAQFAVDELLLAEREKKLRKGPVG